MLNHIRVWCERESHEEASEEPANMGRPKLRWQDCVKRYLAGVGRGRDESEGWGSGDGWWRRQGNQ